MKRGKPYFFQLQMILYYYVMHEKSRSNFNICPEQISSTSSRRSTLYLAVKNTYIVVTMGARWQHHADVEHSCYYGC